MGKSVSDEQGVVGCDLLYLFSDVFFHLCCLLVWWALMGPGVRCLGTDGRAAAPWCAARACASISLVWPIWSFNVRTLRPRGAGSPVVWPTPPLLWELVVRCGVVRGACVILLRSIPVQPKTLSSFFLHSDHFTDFGFSPVLSLAFGLALLLYAFLIELHRFCGACTSFPLLHLINFWCFQFLDYFLVISRACCLPLILRNLTDSILPSHLFPLPIRHEKYAYAYSFSFAPTPPFLLSDFGGVPVCCAYLLCGA